MRITQIFRVEDGPLAGTEMEPVLGFLAIKYPHRKTKDLYVPPMKTKDKEVKTFHCCQENCQQPDFEGTREALIQHLELHAGKLFRKGRPVTKLCPARTVVSLPSNPYENNNQGCNPDQRLAVSLYIDSVKAALEKQGVGIVDEKSQKPYLG